MKDRFGVPEPWTIFYPGRGSRLALEPFQRPATGTLTIARYYGSLFIIRKLRFCFPVLTGSVWHWRLKLPSGYVFMLSVSRRRRPAAGPGNGSKPIFSRLQVSRMATARAGSTADSEKGSQRCPHTRPERPPAPSSKQPWRTMIFNEGRPYRTARLLCNPDTGPS